MAEPAEVFPPIEFIEEELRARKWTLEKLATKMGGDFNTNLCALEFLQCRDKGVRLGEEGADGLARAFGTSAEYWLNLEKAWIGEPVEEAEDGR